MLVLIPAIVYRELLSYLVIREQSVSIDVEQLAIVWVGQGGRGLGQVLGSIQAQERVQPGLHRISTRIPATRL